MGKGRNSFTHSEPLQLMEIYLTAKDYPRYLLDDRLVRGLSQPGALGKGINPLLLLEIETLFLSRTRSQ